jgi:hypothetical protein
MSSFDKFAETKLPPIEAFANDLTGEPCSQEDYDHVCKVWSTFKLKSLKDLCELYVKIDTLQLDAIFHAYRRTSLNSYGLDPVHYFTAPGLVILIYVSFLMKMRLDKRVANEINFALMNYSMFYLSFVIINIYFQG